ncbi:MAG: enoyl-CoA hydratase/isomerase family protein, partial [Chloroflexi bacterium]|nr:enoyl-CoA hydratase/isomerase family protein [Chloroflexota bacterium]
MAYENILVSTDGAIGLIQLNRPNVLNALNGMVMTEVGNALAEFDANDAVRAIIIH